MRLRSKAREVALCLLYQIEIMKSEAAQSTQAYLEEFPQKQEVVDFASQLVKGVLGEKVLIDSLVKKHVKNWEIERMAVIDRNIIRIACFELLFLEDIPPKVSINEAIEIAKRYGDIDSPRFVNGVLDKIYKAESNKVESQEGSNASE